MGEKCGYASRLFDNSISMAREEASVGTSLLTAKEVSRILAISEKTVYKAAKQKRLLAVSLGRSVRFRPEDIAEIRRGLRNL